MTAPIRTHIRKLLKTMWDPVIDLLLVRIGFRIRLADTFRNHARVALGMAGIFAVLALHTS